jgi:uncharacterized lipoprotein YbaY
MNMASGASSRSESPLVRGDITFGEDAPRFQDATAYVRLEDVSVADASSRLIAEQIVRGVSNPPRGGRVPFAVAAEPVDERVRYNVRVLVDLDGDGETSPGDLVTVRSYPVLSQGHPAAVSVRVRRV